MEPDHDRLILFVVGAHLRAELSDRPTAYRLLGRAADWLREHAPETGDDALRARLLVCTDLWYLNDDHLRSRPTVSIGAPGVNALSAFLADKLPSAFAIEDVLLVQADVEFEEPVACCWGATPAATLAAADAFAERYLDDFMRAATRDWDPPEP